MTVAKTDSCFCMSSHALFYCCYDKLTVTVRTREAFFSSVCNLMSISII